MNLRNLADRLEARTLHCPPNSPRADRLQALADAARDLDRLRDYRRTDAGWAFRFPLGDVDQDMTNLRYEIRRSLTIASDLREIA